MGSWTLDDISWDRFDPSKLDPELVRIVKAASLVEHNGAAYAHHLCRIFADDPAFQDTARRWRGGPRSPTPSLISTGRLPAFGPVFRSISTAPARAAARARARWWRAASS